MWLKLTAKAGNKVIINMDKCTSMSKGLGTDEGMMQIYLDTKSSIFVIETLEEIELMLMGSKPSASDPRERNVIGRYIPDDRAEAYLKYGLREEDI